MHGLQSLLKVLFITDLIWENIDAEQVPDLQAVLSLNNMELILSRMSKSQAVDTMTIEDLFAEHKIYVLKGPKWKKNILVRK